MANKTFRVIDAGNNVRGSFTCDDEAVGPDILFKGSDGSDVGKVSLVEPPAAPAAPGTPPAVEPVALRVIDAEGVVLGSVECDPATAGPDLSIKGSNGDDLGTIAVGIGGGKAEVKEPEAPTEPPPVEPPPTEPAPVTQPAA